MVIVLQVDNKNLIGYKNLEVYQKSYNLYLRVHRETLSFPSLKSLKWRVSCVVQLCQYRLILLKAMDGEIPQRISDIL